MAFVLRRETATTEKGHQMTEQNRSGKLSRLGLVLLVWGVGMPCILALVAGLFPSLGWVTPSAGMSGGFARVFTILLGVCLAATGVGFWRGRAWGWWLVMLWGLWAGFELVRGVSSRPLAIVEVPLPLLPAVVLLAYAWNRRGDFVL